MKVCLWLLGSGFAMLLGTCAAPAQTGGCTLQKQVYTCDRAQFQQSLNSAKTARVEASAQDRMVAGKLRDLIVALGKAVPAAEEPADLTFALSAVNTDGVLVGPAGVELAILRVYAHGTDGQKGNLLWAETYRGQPDMSWPAIVQATIQQFRAGLKR